MKTEMTLNLTADEVTKLLVPAVIEKANSDGRFGKFVDASAKEAGGLAVAVTMTFDTEATS